MQQTQKGHQYKFHLYKPVLKLTLINSWALADLFSGSGQSVYWNSIASKTLSLYTSIILQSSRTPIIKFLNCFLNKPAPRLGILSSEMDRISRHLTLALHTWQQWFRCWATVVYFVTYSLVWFHRWYSVQVLWVPSSSYHFANLVEFLVKMVRMMNLSWKILHPALAPKPNQVDRPVNKKKAFLVWTINKKRIIWNLFSIRSVPQTETCVRLVWFFLGLQSKSATVMFYCLGGTASCDMCLRVDSLTTQQTALRILSAAKMDLCIRICSNLSHSS